MRINRLTLAVALVLICAMAAAALPAMTPAAHATAPVTNCDGEGCPSVTLTFDDSKQQYLAQNNSQDRFVRVSASNVAASASACVGPDKSEYLPLKSVVGSYRADHARAKYLPAGGE